MQAVGSTLSDDSRENAINNAYEHGSWHISIRSGYSRKLSDDEGGGLCFYCRQIDFKAVFSMSASETELMGNEICSFTGLLPSMMGSECSLCRALAMKVFAHGTSSTARTFSGRLLAFPVSSILGSDNRSPQGLPIVIGVILGTTYPDWDGLLRCVTNLQGIILPLVEEVNTASVLCHGVNVPRILGYTRVRDMLSRCAKEHAGCRQTTHDFPTRARVIDCRSRRLIPLQSDHRYVALSYVWGSRSSSNAHYATESVTGQGHLPSNLPRTIEDAITTTRRLGMRFLWVDRYCIEQYHSADKKHQLNQMANIYNQAVVTICAIGSHDDVGLPGVSVERNVPDMFHAQGIWYAVSSAPGTLQRALATAVWSTRGWTFQEALLSRRCLIFTEEEVYLVCRFSGQQEGVSYSNCLLEKSPGQVMQTIYSLVLDRELRWSTNDHLNFVDYVQHYQKREFTLDSDALPAFQGILSVSSNQSYYGVVVSQCYPLHGHHDWSMDYMNRAGFVHGLIWEVRWKVRDDSESDDNRRPSVPSWSWLARKIKNASTLFPALALDLTPSITAQGLACVSIFSKMHTYIAQISVSRDGGSSIPISSYLAQHKNSKVVPELSPTLEISSLLLSFECPCERRHRHYTWWENFIFDLHELYPWSEFSTCVEIHFDGYETPHIQGNIPMFKFSTMLLLARRFTQYPHVRSYWLIVRQLDDGAYERMGLFFVSHRPEENIESMLSSNKDKMTTILLR